MQVMLVLGRTQPKVQVTTLWWTSNLVALCTAHFLSMLMLQPDLQLFQLICKVPTLLRLALLGAEAAAAQPTTKSECSAWRALHSA